MSLYGVIRNVVLLILFSLTTTVMGAPATKNLDHHSSFRIEAHRGAGNLEPENSIKAFKRAIELGLDGVELDVWLTKDNIPVVLHGLPGGFVELKGFAKKPIRSLNSKDLGKYLLKNGEKIATLAEVLEICKDKMHINIEIKDVRPIVITTTLSLLDEKEMFDQVSFSSFIHSIRANLTRETTNRELEDQITFGFLINAITPKLPNYETEDIKAGDSLNIDIRYLKQQREKCLAQIALAKAKGMKIVFWFPTNYKNEELHYEDLLEIGADSIITNNPIIARQYFANELSK
jgi:glycerophosphoryl diester phosphodiesterase